MATPKKKKRGAPVKPDAVRRQRMVGFRVTTEEHQKLAEEAASMPGKPSVNNLIRWLVFEARQPKQGA